MQKPIFQNLTLTEKDHIAFLQLSRPKRLNALSNQLLSELALAAFWLNTQKHIQVVIISGAGRTFSAGADIKAFQEVSAQSESWIERRDKAKLGVQMTEAIGNMEAITIAQVHGFAVGGALLLMMACDFRVVAEGTFFSIPEIDLGIPLGWGGIPKLVSEIGALKTKELVMTCRRFDAEEAKSLGIINSIQKAEDLVSYCLNLAKSLASKPSVPIRMTKEQVNAVTKNMGAGYVATAEVDMLQSVMKDPESRVAAEAYLASMLKGK